MYSNLYKHFSKSFSYPLDTSKALKHPLDTDRQKFPRTPIKKANRLNTYPQLFCKCSNIANKILFLITFEGLKIASNVINFKETKGQYTLLFNIS